MNQLTLTCRQAHASLGDGQLQAFRVVFNDQLEQASFLCGCQQLIVAGIEQSENQVLSQGTGKQTTFLPQEAHVFSQQGLTQLGDIHVVKQNPALLWLVHA